jgi:hypothetical protein
LELRLRFQASVYGWLDEKDYSTMEVFEVVKAVLDQEYENIVPVKERDQKIVSTLENLGEIYKKVKTYGGGFI